jgi:hypothetical protein
MQKPKFPGAAGVALGLLLVSTAPALATHRHHGTSHRHHDRAYVDTGRSDGAYAWAPRRYGVRGGWYNSGDVNERLCMLSPASVNYQPCMNHW